MYPSRTSEAIEREGPCSDNIKRLRHRRPQQPAAEQACGEARGAGGNRTELREESPAPTEIEGEAEGVKTDDVIEEILAHLDSKASEPEAPRRPPSRAPR